MENVPPEVDSHGKRRDNNQKDATLLDKDKGCEQTLSETDRKDTWPSHPCDQKPQGRTEHLRPGTC